MNIFVTGATGVLGSEVVPLLVTSGHEVRALSRSRHNIEVLGRLGAEPVSADLAARSNSPAARGRHAGAVRRNVDRPDERL